VGEGLLAVWYGEQAIAWLQTNGRVVALAMGIGALVGGVAYYIWKNRRGHSISGEQGGGV
jgi:hypothetical protein